MNEVLTVVITGATAGVGRATVREFAKKGHRLALIARDSERLRNTKQEAEVLGSTNVMALSADVADYKELQIAVEKIRKELGEIDIWVNNAMATLFSKFENITPDEFKRGTEVTYLGTVYGTMIALKHMKKRNKGVIIQVGSALSYRSIPLQSVYCGAKHAVRGFTDSLRTELMHEKSKMRLTMVQLPGLNTPQFSWARSRFDRHPQPVPPIFQPQLAAKAIYWAAFNDRREIWLGTMTTSVILVNKLFPGVVDRYLVRKGFDSQFTDSKTEKNWPGNLFEPVKGGFSSNGIFSPRAKKTSVQFVFEKIPFIHFFSNIFFASIGTLRLAGNLLGK